MRMLKRRALSVILSFALVFGCFAGTGITAKAAGTFEIGVSAEELESKGGEVAVTVAGEELGDTVWWVLEKQSNAQEGEEAYEIVGGEVNTAEVDAGHKESEFSVNIPEIRRRQKAHIGSGLQKQTPMIRKLIHIHGTARMQKSPLRRTRLGLQKRKER